MKRIVVCCALVLVAAAPVCAMPGAMAGGDKFSAADTDKDGFLSREEFSAAFSGLKKEAFDHIDKDADNKIAAEEWRAFTSGHGKSAPHGDQPADAAHGAQSGEKSGDLPVLTPPSK